MPAANPLRQALQERRFCYVVELVATRLTREAKLLEVASQLAQVPGVVAGSITSYAGGALGHDPIRVGTAARARGLNPNVHLTCVNRTRAEAQRALEDLHALGIQNVLALTGDYPKGKEGSAAAAFELDSVQLVSLIREIREAGRDFCVGVAVSPFKYVEADCVYQYLKLEKKIAAGADFAVTQLGFDARKFRELKTYLDQRNLQTPVLGNVYVLPAKAAEKMAKGEPPGCWVAPELLQEIQEEAQAPDKGLAARLERAARMVAVVRGLGYAGAYLGGEHRADRVRWIIRRSEALAPRWQEFAEEFSYAARNPFYLFPSASAGNKSAPPQDMNSAITQAERAQKPFVPRMLDALGRLFPVKRDGKLRGLLRGFFRWIDKSRLLERGVERFEFAIKRPLFGCEACGNCVLGTLEYVCPQTCPKNLRNGPCGGTLLGRCEVVDKPCIWTEVYGRAKAAHCLSHLQIYVPPRNLALRGTSSWVNYFLERDNRPERAVRLYWPVAASASSGSAALPPSAKASESGDEAHRRVP